MVGKMQVPNEQLMKTSAIIHTSENIPGPANLLQQNLLVINNEYCIPTIASFHHAPATKATKHGNRTVNGRVVDSMAEIRVCSVKPRTNTRNISAGKMRKENYVALCISEVKGSPITRAPHLELSNRNFNFPYTFMYEVSHTEMCF